MGKFKTKCLNKLLEFLQSKMILLPDLFRIIIAIRIRSKKWFWVCLVYADVCWTLFFKIDECNMKRNSRRSRIFARELLKTGWFHKLKTFNKIGSFVLTHQISWLKVRIRMKRSQAPRSLVFDWLEIIVTHKSNHFTSRLKSSTWNKSLKKKPNRCCAHMYKVHASFANFNAILLFRWNENDWFFYGRFHTKMHLLDFKPFKGAQSVDISLRNLKH